MHSVVIYSTDPCPYCSRTKALLAQRGIAYHEVVISRTDHGARDRLVAETGGYTFPQVVIDGTTIGGWTELAALDRSGELATLLG
ncbi:MAG: glutaredoxin 3 [Thermoleophilia bacterium]|nr:glutaredoxin 3 [Thermoleophilia bacterium]